MLRFNIKLVNQAIISVDKDPTVCGALEKITQEFGGIYDVDFAKGGDQNNYVIPERRICEKLVLPSLTG